MTKTEQVIERVAQGVWKSQTVAGNTLVTCAICHRSQSAGHTEWCVVRIAKQVQEEGK